MIRVDKIIISNIVKEVAESLQISDSILSIVDNGDGTTTINTNATDYNNNYYETLLLNVNDYVYFDSDINTVYKVTEVNNSSFIITGEVSGVSIWYKKTPVFYRGTPIDIQLQRDESQMSTLQIPYPVIFHLEPTESEMILTGRNQIGNSVQATGKSIWLVFMETHNEGESRDDIYSDEVTNMAALALDFFKKLDKYSGADFAEPFNQTEHINWGIAVKVKGYTNLIINEQNLSGIEVMFDLKVYKNKNC